MKHNWIPHYPIYETPASNRKSLPGGQQDYPTLITRLESELTKLKARDVVIESGHQATDIRKDGHLKAAAKQPSFPGIVIRFVSDLPVLGTAKLGPLWFRCDAYLTWQDNLKAIVQTLERLRLLTGLGTVSIADLYRQFEDASFFRRGQNGGTKTNGGAKGSTSSRSRTAGTGYQGTKGKANAQTPPPQTPPPPKETPKMRAAKVLLRECGEPDDNPFHVMKVTLDLAEARRLFVRATHKAHPDTGGTDERMRRVNEAWTIIQGGAR